MRQVQKRKGQKIAALRALRQVVHLIPGAYGACVQSTAFSRSAKLSQLAKNYGQAEAKARHPLLIMPSHTAPSLNKTTHLMQPPASEASRGKC